MHGTICIGDAVNWDASINRGLVSWWLTLPEQQRGVIFRDLCMRNHGTLSSSLEWHSFDRRPGGVSALHLGHSTTDELSHPRPSMTAIAAFSFVAWFYFDADPTNAGLRINAFGKWDMGTGVKQHFARWSAGMQWFVRNSADTLEASATIASANINTPGWNFLGFVADGANLLTYYGPGLAGGTAALTGPYIPSDTDNWVFGDARAASSPLEFYIDDAAYFNRALSASELAARFHKSRRGYEQELNWLRRPAVGEAAAAVGGLSIPIAAYHYNHHLGSMQS